MKKLVALLMVLSLALALTACGAKENETETADSTIAAQKTFIVGFDAEFPPYGYLDEKTNEYTGFDLDLAKEVCARKGWKFVAQPVKWEAKDSELKSGTIDCIWNGFTMSDDRIDSYEWSDAYVDNTQVIVVRTDSKITKQSELAGKNVEVQADSSALEALNGDDFKALTASFKNLTQVKDYITAFMDLESGACDAIAMDIGVAKVKMADLGEDKYTILKETLVSEKYGIGFLKGNTALRDEVQTTLDEMMKDGKFAEIAKKWDLTDCVIIKK